MREDGLELGKGVAYSRGDSASHAGKGVRSQVVRSLLSSGTGRPCWRHKRTVAGGGSVR